LKFKFQLGIGGRVTRFGALLPIGRFSRPWAQFCPNHLVTLFGGVWNERRRSSTVRL